MVLQISSVKLFVPMNIASARNGCVFFKNFINKPFNSAGDVFINSVV
jgi:hypothetical protein